MDLDQALADRRRLRREGAEICDELALMVAAHGHDRMGDEPRHGAEVVQLTHHGIDKERLVVGQHLDEVTPLAARNGHVAEPDQALPRAAAGQAVPLPRRPQRQASRAPRRPRPPCRHGQRGRARRALQGCRQPTPVALRTHSYGASARLHPWRFPVLSPSRHGRVCPGHPRLPFSAPTTRAGFVSDRIKGTNPVIPAQAGTQ